MNDREALSITLDCIAINKHGEAYISILNTIANLMRELNERHSKATYTRTYTLGRLTLTLDYNGMK